jgi:Eukaryotic cytochrome b561
MSTAGLRYFSICAAVIVSCLVCLWCASLPGGLRHASGLQLFNWHPLLMCIAVLICLCGGVLVWAVPGETDASTFRMELTHGALMLAGFILINVAVTIAVVSKQRMGLPHMYSLHSWLGIASVFAMKSNVFFGVIFAQRLFPISAARKDLYRPYHRLSGVGALALAGAAVLTGFTRFQDVLIQQSVSVRAPSAAFANYLGLAVVLVFTATAYTRSRPRPLRDATDAGGNAVDGAKV